MFVFVMQTRVKGAEVYLLLLPRRGWLSSANVLQGTQKWVLQKCRCLTDPLNAKHLNKICSMLPGLFQGIVGVFGQCEGFIKDSEH